MGAFKWFERNLHFFAIVLLLLFAGILLFNVHHNFEYYRTLSDSCASCAKTPVDYPYPVHADEWAHLSKAEHMIDNEGLYLVNPYTGEYRQNLEPGFTVFIAQFFLMTGIDSIYGFQYLNYICIFVVLLTLIAFCFALTGSYWTGILASLFFLSVKSTVNILGLWFFLPSIFSLFILFIFLYALISKKFYLAGAFFILSIFVYPILTVFLGLCYISLLFSWPKLVRRNKQLLNKYKFGLILAGILFLFAVLGMLFYFHFDLNEIVNGLFFKFGWTIYFERTYSLLDHYTLIGFGAAIVGLFFLFREKLNKGLIFPLLFCVMVVSSWFLFKVSFVVPYQRGYLYMLLITSVFSGIGIYYILVNLNSFFNKKFSSQLKLVESLIIKGFFLVILLVPLFIFQFNNYYETKDATFWPQFLVSEKDVSALTWVQVNTDKNAVVIVPPQIVFASFPLSHRQTIAVIPSNLESGPYDLIFDFYNSNDCAKQKEIIKQTSATLIYSYYPLYCGFKEIYSRNGVYIYTN